MVSILSMKAASSMIKSDRASERPALSLEAIALICEPFLNIRTNSYSQNKNLVYSDFDESISSQFNSNISYSKTFKGTPFNFSTNLRHSQNVQTQVVNLTLPSLNYNMNRIYPFKNLGKLGKTFLGKLNFSHRFTSRNHVNQLM